jgi:KaiC/GvpD/RAD55 family RecA-like ATPase
LSINIPTTHTHAVDITELYVKRFIYGFISELRGMKDVTSLLISQTTDSQLSRDTVSEFICDGIILMAYETMGGDYSRSLIVRKMREVYNDDDVHPVEIGKRGIIVHNLKE